MKRTFLWAMTAAALAMVLFAPACRAQGLKVAVVLPDAAVTINGTEIDNNYLKYPLIEFKNITYFPMTYNDCRFLGLESYWEGAAKGLTLEKTGVTAAYNPCRTSVKNRRDQTAAIAGFPVAINGKAIDNRREEYPLLSFRDVTYFPLTWRYGVDEFGWDYSFDKSRGLVINSNNITLKEIPLSNDRAKDEEGKFKNNVAVSGGYAYYEGTNGRIMRSPLSDSASARAVYQLPLWSYGDGTTYVYAGLDTGDGAARLSYHQGGATMGTDYLIRLNDDGTTTLLNNTGFTIKSFGDKSIRYWTGPAPGAGNLSIKTGGSEWHQLGSPDYLYGWIWEINGEGSGCSGSKDACLVGDELYILAFDTRAKNAVTGICKVNINTSQTARISERQVSAFQIEGDYIYYSSQGGMYRYSISSGREELLKKLVQAPGGIKSFMIFNESIFWQNDQDLNLYDFEGNNVNPGAVLDDMKTAGDNGEYLVCTFQDTPEAKYRVMIFDKTGDVIFKTSDKAYGRNISISGSTLWFYNITAGTVCTGQL